jgi:hypothetical protein
MMGRFKWDMAAACPAAMDKFGVPIVIHYTCIYCRLMLLGWRILIVREFIDLTKPEQRCAQNLGKHSFLRILI